MDIEIGEIDTNVRVSDDAVLVDPKVKHMLMHELMRQVHDVDAHAQRVRRERGVNAGRTTESEA